MCSLICKMESDPEIYRWNLGSVGYFCIKKAWIGKVGRSWFPDISNINGMQKKWTKWAKDEMQRIWDSMSVSTQDSSNHVTCSCLYDFAETFAVFPKYHPKFPQYPIISQIFKNIKNIPKHPTKYPIKIIQQFPAISL